MQAHGVGMQVLSPIPATLSYTLPAKGAVELCERQNEWLAGVVAADGGHFAALGAVPLQDPVRSGAMVPEVMEMGLSGVEIGTNIAGVSLDDPRFADFFASCAEAGAVVFVHPLDALGGDRLTHHQLATSIGFLTETAEAAASLVLGGVMDRHPGLKVVLAHGGGAFVPSLPRLDRCWEVLPPARGVCRERPSAYAPRFTYDTLVYDGALLQHVVGVVGASHLVIGSDYPFALAEVPAGSLVHGLACSDADRAAISRTNAAALLGLDDASLTPSPS